MKTAKNRDTNLKTIDILAIIVLCGQIVAWIMGGGLLFGSFSIAAGPDPGDAGLGVLYIAICAGFIGLGVTIISAPFAIMAKRIPIWGRCLLVLSPATAVALATVLFALL